MFMINVGTTISPVNYIEKEFNTLFSVQGTLKTPSSIIDPVVTILMDNNEAYRMNMNYAYIPAFGRYYYITNIVAVQGVVDDTSQTTAQPHQLWQIHMHVDVLMSFKDQIKQQEAVVARQENTYNLMLDDGFFMCYQNPKLQTKLFSVDGPFEHQEFVLIAAGSS